MTTPEPSNLTQLRDSLRQFAADRDWEQFHSPKNLAMALASEAGELVEIFQWLSDAESRAAAADRELVARSKEELADIAIYLVRLSDVMEIDLAAAIDEKMVANARRYPISLAKGNARKRP
jgi:NTP pyrophosphatase (non-canonical NTP hydrolase)